MDKQLEQYGFNLVDKLVSEGLTKASPGSGMYLLYGRRPSPQSINIKFGRAFEKWFEYAVMRGNNNFEIMPSGVWKEISKDLDLIFRDDEQKIIHYRELKLNFNLDTEKIVSTYEKIVFIRDFLRTKYPDYHIDAAALTWGTYDQRDMTAQSKIIKGAQYDVTVEDPNSFFKLIGAHMTKKAYNSYFRNVGNKLEQIINEH